MKINSVYRITITGADGLRQYHLHSWWLAELYLQTYKHLGKTTNLEQLIDGLWQPANI